jgi:hypothetical protein
MNQLQSLFDWLNDENKGLNYYLPPKFADESQAFKDAYLEETQRRMRAGMAEGLRTRALQSLPGIFQYANFDPSNDNDPDTNQSNKGYFDTETNTMGLNTMNSMNEFVKTLLHENVHSVRKMFQPTAEMASTFWDKISNRDKKSLVDRYNTWTKNNLGYSGTPFTMQKDPYYKGREEEMYNVGLEEVLADSIGRDGGPSAMQRPGTWNEKEWEMMKDYWRYKYLNGF